MSERERSSLSREEADRRQREETRKRILEAASKVFMSKDYHTATTKEIAELAGVAKGSVFNHFRNKEELVYETLRFIFLEEFETMFEVLSSLSPAENIATLVDWTLELSSKSSRVVMLMLQLSVEVLNKSNTSELSIKLYNEMLELLERGIKESLPIFEELGFEDPLAASQVFFALLDGISAHQILFKDKRSQEESKKIRDLIVNMFVKGGILHE